MTLRVYDSHGRAVRTLVDGYHVPGDYAVAFDPGDLASGTYLVRLEAGGRASARAITLLK